MSGWVIVRWVIVGWVIVLHSHQVVSVRQVLFNFKVGLLQVRK